MTDFRGITVADVATRVRNRETTARQQTEIALSAIDEYNPTVRAFVAVDGERALEEADRIDERLAAGEDVGPLAGVPIGVKDLEDAVGFVTTHGSRLYADDPPATCDSALVERLRAAGCVVVGKTNTPEFGCQGDTTNEVFPDTTNPWNPDRSAGGSSGGAAAALAAGMVPLATGSDGGGSIRIPSALCGLSGLKPSCGRIPNRSAEAPNWLHYSISGPMARTIADVALALDSVVGFDPVDLTSLPAPHGPSWLESLDDLRPPRAVLWSPDLGYGTTDSEIASVLEGAVRKIEDAGVEVIEVDRVFNDDPIRHWAAVAFGGLRRKTMPHRDTADWERYSPILRALTELAADDDNIAVLDALAAGHSLNYRLVELFHQAPLLLCPTVAGQTGRPRHQGTIDGQETVSWVTYTPPFNMTGNPAGSMCAGFTADGMPIGLQVVGPQHGDVAVLRAIAAFEEILDVDTVAPLAWS